MNKKFRPEELLPLFAEVDWAKNRDIADIGIMLASTPLQVTAWQGEQMVGFLRALSDGVYRALIEDVIVDNRHRGQGIGRKLVELAIEELAPVQEIMLGCTNDNVPFYQQFGFEPVSVTFMHRIS